jgi:hypothetical protein
MKNAITNNLGIRGIASALIKRQDARQQAIAPIAIALIESAVRILFTHISVPKAE